MQFSDEWCQSLDYSNCGWPEEWKYFLKNNKDIQINYQSKWFNIVSITLPNELLATAESLPFTTSIRAVGALYPQTNKADFSKEYAFALEQMKASYLTDSMKLSGKGVKIGVIDGGFMKADQDPALQNMIKNGQVIYFKDYLLDKNEDAFYGRRIAHDDHGTDVLKMIAGFDAGINIQYGMATDANYYLARTDHGIRENRLEEDYWLMAVESFYEMGVKLVNSSLGYTDGFDKKKENHHVKEVDGKSSIITRAAQKAAEKGMLLVISAGNDGANKKWETLSLPADAKDVLTVGSVLFDEWTKVYYSSTGPEKIDYVKPDVVCFASNGTSFSAPVITGLAACIWQYDSTLTNYEVMDIIKKSGHIADVPNNFLGYGIPDGERIRSILMGNFTTSIIKKKLQKGDNFQFALDDEIPELILFHKKDERNVLLQESLEVSTDTKSISIERKEKAAYTTIVSRNKLLIEVEWID
ncbi:S8 family serine peptidase [Marivirga sp. S37H4]|uniref:S8 family serine peptidase n=1 Tax=Marivirga aurantiaca TaxID=2802615 RepID=A0A934WUW9_9BACT|nr:S8 family serine peptidase [Marivirga aurantiaca]MBK6263478.1 S8 family serine peptidase [Marivirga aurantiaca]